MNLIRLIKIEIGKLKRSKIGLILLIPVLLVWISGIMNADMNFEMQAEGISRRITSSSSHSWDTSGLCCRQALW